METIKFNKYKLDNFSILLDQKYPGTDIFFNYDNNKFLNLIDGILGSIQVSDKLEVYTDHECSYKYYMLTYMKNVQKWYTKDSFTLYVPKTEGKSKELIFVKNNKNGWLDNVIYKKCLDDIKERIYNNENVYVATSHAIERAKTRLPELYDCKSKFKISRWLLKRVNKESKLAHVKKEFAIMSLLNHNFESANYYMDKQRNVYVVVDHTVMTVHCNESERFKLN